MERKMKLIYKLLEYMASCDRPARVPEIEGYTDEQVHYHVGLCSQAGYMEIGKPGFGPEGIRYSSMDRLTWAGHEALDKWREGRGQ